MPPTSFIEVEDLNKSFGAVRALKGISLQVRAGEVLGLIGANGAGKSSLVRVLSGATRPDSGRVSIDGEEVAFRSPREALAAGVARDPQELNLVDQQSIADNLFMAALPRRAGIVRERDLDERARAALDGVGLGDLDPRALAGTLTPVQARLVSVAAQLARNPRLLVLDEPSAALPPETAGRLGPIVRRLTESGAAVIYVSHRLNEIRTLCDRVIAMRDGAIAGELPREEATEERMVELVGGRALAAEPAPTESADLTARVVVRTRGLSGRKVQDVDLDVHAGEIVGVGGLYGSGRSELLRLIGGVQAPTAGVLEVDGAPGPRSPHAAAARGIGYLAEGRKLMIFPTMTVTSNATMSVLRRLSPFMVKPRRERLLFGEMAGSLNLVGGLDAPMSTLSGGNQQKVCLSRWLLREAGILLFDEPTVGIDVHARAEIHNILRDLAAGGTTIVVASAEPEELALICDRVVVMVEGRLVRELRAPFDADSVVAASYAARAA